MATITASVAGGNWNANGTWIGGVQPGAGDDVLLTATSGNITIPAAVTALCRSLVCTGFTGSLTFAATTSNLNIGDASGGALTLVSGMTLTLTGLGTINFVSTSNNGGTGWAVTTAGKTLPNVTFNGAGGKWVQADALTATGATITLTAGTYDNTASFSLSCGKISGSGSSTRALLLGSSVVTVTAAATAVDFTSATALTLTPGTSSITLTGAGAGFVAGNLTWYDVSFTGSGVSSITGSAPSFHNLTRTGTANKTDALSIGTSPVTVTGALTLNANSSVNRLLVQSGTIGTSRTITAGSLVCTNVVDFQDITGAGAATWTTAASGATFFGDCQGNSGITFTVAATQTHTASAGGNWSDVTKWTSRVPLPQDNVIVDVNTTGTLTADMPRLGKSIDFTGFAATWTNSVANTSFGNWTFASGMTVSGTQPITWAGRSTQTVTFAGKTLNAAVTINAVGGTYTMQDALTMNASQFTHNFGTFDANVFNVTFGLLGTGTSGTRQLKMGSGTWSLTTTAAGSLWEPGGASPNVLCQTSTIVISAASANSRTFTCRAQTYNILTYTVAGSTGTLVLNTAGTFGTLNFSDATNARTLTLPSSTTTTITTPNILGTAGKLMTINSSSPGVAATIAKAGGGTVILGYLSVQDSTASPATTWYAGTTSTDAGGNTNWLFIDMPIGKQIGVVWPTRAAVGQQKQALWPVRAVVGQQKQALWPDRLTVGQQRQALWPVGAAVGQQKQAVWPTRATVGQQRQLIWPVRVTVGQQEQILWAVRTAISQQIQTVWPTRATAGQQRQVLWPDRTLVGQSRQVLWPVRAAVGQQDQVLWPVRTPVGQQNQVLWSVRTLTGQQRQVLWPVGAAVGASRQALWPTRATVGQQRQVLWPVRTVVPGISRQVLWPVRTVVGRSCRLVWAVGLSASSAECVLGCPETRVLLMDRCGSRVIKDITDSMSSGSYGRLLDDTSAASVTVSVSGDMDRASCSTAVGNLGTWRNSLAMYRDDKLTWFGPITNLLYATETAVVSARDISAWLDVRVIHNDYTFTDELATDIVRILIEDALSVEDPCGLLGNIVVTGTSKVRLTGSVTAGDGYAGDIIRNLAASVLDFTVLGTSIIISDKFEFGPFTRLTDEDFLVELQIEERGADAGTKWYVNGSAVQGQAGGTDPYVGLIERVVTDTSILDAAAATTSAKGRLSTSNPPPVFINIPDGARLSPLAPVCFEQLVPGTLVNVSLRNTARQVSSQNLLTAIQVTLSGSDESVGVSLSPTAVSP